MNNYSSLSRKRAFNKIYYRLVVIGSCDAVNARHLEERWTSDDKEKSVR